MDDNAVYDIDAEMSVLGSLMIDGERIAKVMEILTHEDFYDRRNELVFRGMEWLAKKGVEIDIITLSDALKQAKVLDEIGGSAYLAEVTNYVPTSLHSLTHAKM